MHLPTWSSIPFAFIFALAVANHLAGALGTGQASLLRREVSVHRRQDPPPPAPPDGVFHETSNHVTTSSGDNQTLTFSILTSDPACETEFFGDLLTQIRAHPAYVAEPDKATLIFTQFDSMRQCIYPYVHYSCINHKGKNGNATKEMSFADPTVHSLADVSLENYHPDDIPRDVWASMIQQDPGACRFQGDDDTVNFINAVKDARNGALHDKVFVYLANANQQMRPEIHGSRDIDKVREFQAQSDAQIFTVSLDLLRSQANPKTDINLLMPLLPKSPLYKLTDEAVPLCVPRNTLVSFAGFNSTTTTGIRQRLFNLNSESAGVLCKSTCGMGDTSSYDMKAMLLNSTFGFAPRGDNHYSFRIAETLATGTVPVIIDDDFTPPYRGFDLFSWAIVIGESDIEKAGKILRGYNSDTICRMQRRGRQVLQYARDMKGTVEGMLHGLRELHKPGAGVLVREQDKATTDELAGEKGMIGASDTWHASRA